MQTLFEYAVYGWIIATVCGTLGLMVSAARDSLSSHSCKGAAHSCENDKTKSGGA